MFEEYLGFLGGFNVLKLPQVLVEVLKLPQVLVSTLDDVESGPGCQ